MCRNSAICENLSVDIRATWSKYVSRLRSLISLSLSNAFTMSTFRVLSRRVTPKIFLKSDVSKTLSFRL